ncbi:ataxin-2-like protein [Xenentodon cancila]
MESHRQAFEGVYNNARMLHFLTSVVGSTCHVRVKNGAVYEGIFKTLSAQCELAVDAVHKRSDGLGGRLSPSSLPKMEDITDIMIFSPSDLVTMTCTDVDLNFAVRDTFTDSAISSSRLNGEHHEKVLQRWNEDGNGENVELDSDMSNGWDANEMFKFNEETYGVTSTYSSSLSSYTMPLERGNSEVYEQREARAARLAGEIESSLQYRRRISLENDEGRSEEEKYSSVVRETEGGGSPGLTSSGSGRYQVSPSGSAAGAAGHRRRRADQQQVLLVIVAGERLRSRCCWSTSPASGSAAGAAGHRRRRADQQQVLLVIVAGELISSRCCWSSSPESGSAAGAAGHRRRRADQQQVLLVIVAGELISSRESKCMPVLQRAREISLSSGTMTTGGSGRPAASTSSRHVAASSSTPKPSSDRSTPPSARTAHSSHQSQSSLPCSSHALLQPGTLADAMCTSFNGVSSRTSPKSQRLQSSRGLRSANCQTAAAASRVLRPDVPPQEPPPVGPAYLDSSLNSFVTTATTITKPSGPVPLFPVDVSEILITAAKERTEDLPGPQEGRSHKGPSVQQRAQLEELRKFGKEFRLQPSSSPTVSPASADPPPPDGPARPPSSSSSPSKPATPSVQDLQGPTETAPPISLAAAPPPLAPPGPHSSGPEAPQPSGGEEACPASGDYSEAGSASQVKNSKLNPNAKEFLPVKVLLSRTALKPAAAQTPPRLAPPSPSVVLPPPAQPGGGSIYSSPPAPYLSYMPPVPMQGHSVQPPQLYQYMSTIGQPRYPRGSKGPVVGPRPYHHTSSSSPLISAPGPPLVASPYPQSYLQYAQVVQAMPPHYHGQTVYSLLQGGVRMLASGNPPIGPPGPQYPSRAEGPPGPQQAVYVPQSFSHHSGSVHPPQPSSTPTGNQPPLQHTAPSPGHAQVSQGGPQHQSLFPSGGLSAPTPPSVPQGHGSLQVSYPPQGYSLPAHGFASISQLPQVNSSICAHERFNRSTSKPNGCVFGVKTKSKPLQAHVPGGLPGPARHGPPPIFLHYVPPQQGSSSTRQHGPPPQQGAPQHFYIGPPQAVQVQASQQLSFHTSAN